MSDAFPGEPGPAWYSMLRKSAIIAAYVLVFWIALPFLLFSIGARLDVLLAMNLPRTQLLSFFGWSLATAGMVVVVTASGQLLLQGKGYPISHLPPAAFVANGIFRVFRHPIYVGYTTAFAGAAVLVSSAGALLFSLPLLVIGWLCYTRFYEEPVLVRRFGSEYRTHMQRTRLAVRFPGIRALRPRKEPLERFLQRALTAVAGTTVLARFGNIIVVAFGVFAGAGTIAFFLVVSAYAPGLALSHQKLQLLFAGTIICTAGVARLFSWIGHWKDNPASVLSGLRRTGFVSWGGVLGLVGFSEVFARTYRLPFLAVTDLLFVGGFVFYAFGRLGCLSYGCCYGVTGCPHGVLFTHRASKIVREQGVQHIPRHPVQFYSFLHGTALFSILNVLVLVRPPEGCITAIALLLYAIGRAIVEFFRDRPRYAGGVLTAGHAGCALMFLAGWTLLYMVQPDRMGSLRPLSVTSLSTATADWPFILICGFAVFMIAGFHWKQIGTW